MARNRVARFIGAPERPRCRNRAATPSEALNIVAKAFAPTVLEPGDEVCITIMEHHSNLIPWQQACRAAGAKLVYLYPDENGVITPEEMDAKIGPKTKIRLVRARVQRPWASRTPSRNSAAACMSRAATWWSTARQSVPHVHVRRAGRSAADFFAFSAHKLFGPFGMGVLWGKRRAAQRHAAVPHGRRDDRHRSPSKMPPGRPCPRSSRPARRTPPASTPPPQPSPTSSRWASTSSQAREQALVRYCMEETRRSSPFVTIIGQPRPRHAPRRHQLQCRTASTRTTWPASWTWTRWPSAPGIIARSRCSPGWAWRTLPAAARQPGVLQRQGATSTSLGRAGLESTFGAPSMANSGIYTAGAHGATTRTPTTSTTWTAPPTYARGRQPQLRRRAHAVVARRGRRDRGSGLHRSRLRREPGFCRHDGRRDHRRDRRRGTAVSLNLFIDDD